MASSLAVGITVTFTHAGGTFAGEIVDVNHSGAAADVVDSTHQTVPGNVRRFKPGLINQGQFTLSVLYDPSATAVPGPAAVATALAYIDWGATAGLRMEMPIGTFAVSLDITGALGAMLTADLNFQITDITGTDDVVDYAAARV